MRYLITLIVLMMVMSCSSVGKERIVLTFTKDNIKSEVERTGLFVFGETEQVLVFNDDNTSATSIITHGKTTIGSIGSAGFGAIGGFATTGTPLGAGIGAASGAVIHYVDKNQGKK